MKMTLFSILVLSFGLATRASEFLVASPHEFTEHVSEDSIRTSLLSEISGSLTTFGTAGSANRLAQMETSLGPIYAALPKNQYGNLEHITARYALHRLFVARHGWAIKGLEPSGGTYNSSSPAGVLKDQVPAYIEDMFDQSGKGFKLHELAVLAATIEHLIQEETVGKLGAAFKIHDGLLTGTMGHEEATLMLDTYMMAYILSENLVDMEPAKAEKLRSEIPEMFMYWPQTQAFVRRIHKEIVESASDPDSEEEKPVLEVQGLSFGALAKVAEAVGDQFGKFFDDNVCKTMKASLMDLEYRDSGSIRLSEFYKPALNGFWTFQESAGYLRELGVLEESDPKEPRVMIANYLLAPSNCIASSGFYSVCCKNECEGLLGHLEEKIAAPGAKPEMIAALVMALPSSTVLAPRNLSTTSLRRLDEIAANHGGMVPLHGRLFAQWMHHAYPRECAYPHITGTTSPKLPEEWLEATGDEPTATEEEMRQYIQWSTNSTRDVLVEDLMPWSSEEELLVVRPFTVMSESFPDAPSQKQGAKRSAWLFAVAGSLAYALIRTMKVTGSYVGSYEEPHKFVI